MRSSWKWIGCFVLCGIFGSPWVHAEESGYEVRDQFKVIQRFNLPEGEIQNLHLSEDGKQLGFVTGGQYFIYNVGLRNLVTSGVTAFGSFEYFHLLVDGSEILDFYYRDTNRSAYLTNNSRQRFDTVYLDYLGPSPQVVLAPRHRGTFFGVLCKDNVRLFNGYRAYTILKEPALRLVFSDSDSIAVQLGDRIRIYDYRYPAEVGGILSEYPAYEFDYSRDQKLALLTTKNQVEFYSREGRKLGKIQSFNPLSHPRFSEDSQSIFFLEKDQFNQDALVAFDVKTGVEISRRQYGRSRIKIFDSTANRTRFLVLKETDQPNDPDLEILEWVGSRKKLTISGPKVDQELVDYLHTKGNLHEKASAGNTSEKSKPFELAHDQIVSAIHSLALIHFLDRYQAPKDQAQKRQQDQRWAAWILREKEFLRGKTRSSEFPVHPRIARDLVQAIGDVLDLMLKKDPHAQVLESFRGELQAALVSLKGLRWRAVQELVDQSCKAFESEKVAAYFAQAAEDPQLGSWVEVIDTYFEYLYQY